MLLSTGKVKWFNEVAGFGFITPDDGSKDVFVHASALKSAGITTLRSGQALRYKSLRAARAGYVRAESLTLMERPLSATGARAS